NKAALGYQIGDDDRDGRWILRRFIGKKYKIVTLGRADDHDQANGDNFLSYEQAESKARAVLNVGADNKPNLTVRAACAAYEAYKRSQGKVLDCRVAVHILPTLGDILVSDLDAQLLRNWLADMAAAPAQKRPKRNKVQERAAPKT